MTFKAWWDANKVLVLGLIGFLVLTIQQLTNGVENIDWRVVSLAVAIGAAGYVGKNWRGQSTSIIGIIGNIGIAVYEVYQSGHFTWLQVGLHLGTLYLFTSAPDPKSRGYEQTDTIRNAKIQGEVIKPAALTNIEIKKEAKATTET